MPDLLPIGAYVRVTPRPIRLLDGRTEMAEPQYIGKVRGYDLGRTKYQISERCAGRGRWWFAAGGRWEFVDDVEGITEEEALS